MKKKKISVYKVFETKYLKVFFMLKNKKKKKTQFQKFVSTKKKHVFNKNFFPD